MSSASNPRLLLLIFVLVSSVLLAQQKKSPQGSEDPIECDQTPSISIAVFAPEVDKFPLVDLRLIDPLKRTAGYGLNSSRIPHSRYGRVLLMPRDPTRSKTVAIEICKPVPGPYEVEVAEHESLKYWLRYHAEDGKGGNEGGVITLFSHPNEVCRIKLNLVFESGKIRLRSSIPSCESVPVSVKGK